MKFEPAVTRPVAGRRPGAIRWTLALLAAVLVAGCRGDDAALPSASQVVDMMRHALAAGDPPGVLINEVVAGAWTGARDEDGDAEDWVELHNPGAAPMDLTGFGLSNKPSSPFMWVFPSGTTIRAGGHLRVWLSKKDRAVAGRPLHASFNLDSGADGVLLTASNATAAGVLVDSATPPLLQADHSWCRLPSGARASPFMVCAQATPGAANAGPGLPAILATPTLSPGSGFHAAPVTVTASGPAGATLRYTTDGSEPTESSAVLAGPLTVADARVLRVAAFSDNAARSLVATGTYVVDAAQAAKYSRLRAMMVALSPADLAQFQANNQDVVFRASFELISGATTSLFRLDAEGSAGGNAGSDDSPARVMDVAARDGLGAKSFPVGGLWADKPGVKSAKKFRLRNGSNDWADAHLRDQLSQRISAGGPNVIASSTPVAMFVNGRYYAMMDLREREEETLLANNLGIEKDFVDYVRETAGQPSVKNGGAPAALGFAEMKRFVTSQDMSVAANYARATTLLNPESLAYDWALHMFHANDDWPDNNIDVWRSPEVDGRWTWRPHDMDRAFGLYGKPPSLDMTPSFGMVGAEVMAALLRNTDFRHLYLNMVADQMNVMPPAVMKAALDTMAAELRPYIADNHAALGLGTVADWEASIDQVRRWMDAREAHHDEQHRRWFGLAARQPLRVAVNDLSMGHVSVNLVDTRQLLTPAQPVWTGLYYPGVPVTLEARPRPGHVFVGWQGASSATTRRIAITLAADAAQPVALTARFAPLANPEPPLLAPVAAQSHRTGDTVHLALSASQANGYALSYAAKTLPKGVSINPATGIVHGRITTPGTYASTLSVTDGLNTTRLPVVWTVSDRPGSGTLGTSPGYTSPPPPNTPPTVALSAPAGDISVGSTTPVTLTALAADADGRVVRVDFLDGDTLLASLTSSPYTVRGTGAPGVHVITALAVDDTGASTRSAPVTVTVLAASGGSGTGLTGRYFANTRLSGEPVLTRREAVDFAWGDASPGAGVPADGFSARWSGWIEAPQAGAYSFQTTSDDGVRVWIAGRLVIDNWAPHGPAVDTSPVLDAAAPGRFPIVVEYREITGGATLQLRWRPPGAAAFGPVPVDRLYGGS